jgi:hypothetical protein
VSGELPRTTSGIPSCSPAKAHIKTKADELLWALQEEYGLTDVLAEIAQGFIRPAVRDQQKRSKVRAGAFGTPQQD